MDTATREASPCCEKSANPSPCAIATGMREPSIPAKKIDGDDSIRTNEKRASNFSDLLRVNFGHASAPGIIDAKLLIIWQPLQMPSANVSARPKNAENISASCGLKRIVLAQPSPAPSTSPYEKPPHATAPLKSASVARPDSKSLIRSEERR